MNTKILTNREKRTVTYIISDYSDYDIDRIIEKYMDASCLPLVFAYRYDFPKEFVGIAKCHPADEWNEEEGIKLARKRAESQLKREKNKILECYIRRLRYAADLIENYGLK